jgi:hypothetical protein
MAQSRIEPCKGMLPADMVVITILNIIWMAY